MEILTDERFHEQPVDKWGQVYIADICNTEPVCLIYAKYHPYAVEVILKALRDYEQRVQELPRLKQYLKEKDEGVKRDEK